MNSSAAVRPMNRWNHDRIQPGIVGPVGDVVCTTRLKHSCPELPIRWQNINPDFTVLGSNIQDGQIVSYTDGGAVARVKDSNWQSGRNFKTSTGWVIEDITSPDKLVEPFVSSLGDYTWRDKIATVYEARRTGAQFLPIPGPYQLSPGEFARGGNSVRVTDIIGGEIGNNSFDDSQEAIIPTGVYGRSTGTSTGSEMGGEYSARKVGGKRGSGLKML